MSKGESDADRGAAYCGVFGRERIVERGRQFGPRDQIAVPRAHETAIKIDQMTGNDADGKRGGDRPPTLDEWRAACAAPFLRGGEIDDVSLARRFGERGERSEEHTSELQSLMRISYAVFCLKKKQHATLTTSAPT